MKTSWSCWCAVFRTSTSRTGSETRFTKETTTPITSLSNGSGAQFFRSPTRCELDCCSSWRERVVCRWTASKNYTDQMVLRCLRSRSGERRKIFRVLTHGEIRIFIDKILNFLHKRFRNLRLRCKSSSCGFSNSSREPSVDRFSPADWWSCLLWIL